LADFDIGFSIGYELTLTNLLNILDLGNIPYYGKRDNTHPLVIAGGPVVSILTLIPVYRAAFIGEAEDFIQSVFPRLALLKKRGRDRRMVKSYYSTSSVWSPGNPIKS
jgi:hypothetical protein